MNRSPPREHVVANQLAILSELQTLNGHLEKTAQTSNEPAEADAQLEAILGVLQDIKKQNKPRHIFLRATLGTTKTIAKFPFQLASSVLKAAGMTIGLPSLIAIGIYTGNGGDPMDIPCNVAEWSEKHFGSQAELTLMFSQACALFQNGFKANDLDGEYELYSPPIYEDNMQDLFPSQGSPS